MLTLEFKAYLTPEQQQYVDFCLDKLRVVWNLGLNALQEFDTFTGYYDKETKSYLPCCPIQWCYHNVYLDAEGRIVRHQSDSRNKIKVPYCGLLDDQSRWYVKRLTRVRIKQPAEHKDSWGWQSPKDSPGCNGYSCPIPQVYRKPLLQNSDWKSKGGLGLIVKAENIDSDRFPWLLDIPYKYRAGVMSTLSVSWQEYIKSRFAGGTVPLRGKPRYKRRGQDELDTLVHPNPKGVIVPDPNSRNQLKGVPGLRVIKLKGLSRRWRNPDGSVPAIASFRITRRPSGYYVQLSGDIHKKLKLRKTTNKAVGIDPGLNHLLSTDGGKHYENPRFLRKSEVQRQKIERRLAKKLTHRLILWINHPGRTIEDIRNICPQISIKIAQNLLSNRPIIDEKVLIEEIGSSALNSLKYKSFQRMDDSDDHQSNREKRERKRIARMHERTRLQRRNYNHKITSHLVKNFAAIATEDTQTKNLMRRAKPKEREDGKGYERNNAKAKSGLSKSFSDASIGQINSFLEQKCKDNGRRFKRIAAHGTSQECPVCNHRQDMPLDIRWFQCERCGFECDRDQKAAISILALAGFEDVKLSNASENAKALKDARKDRCTEEDSHKQERNPSSKRASRKSSRK